MNEDAANASMPRRFGAALALALAWTSLLCFSIPALLYAGNRDEFGTPFPQLSAPVLAPALAVAVAFALFAALLPARLHVRAMRWRASCA